MAVKFVSPLGLPVAATDQAAPSVAQIYFNSTTKKVKVYKSTGWAEIGGSASGSSGEPGMITSWAGSHSNVPSGWILCNGDAVSRTTYADLFAVIGTNYGVGNGTTTFNLPYYDDYWLIGAPSSLSTAPDHNGLPGSWRVASGVQFYDSFSHSTNGAHSSHATSMTTAGGHNHTASHTHVVTSAASAGATEGSHTASGVFNAAGAAHTHSVTSGGPSATAAIFEGVGSSVSFSGHTHVISLASGGDERNHVVSGVSYSGTVSHVSHQHAIGTGTSDDASAMGINAAHGHTMSALASAGGHAHATHDPKQQLLYYIIKT
jgi:microcystin-dependent protein